jgi:hypothetical protein
MAVGRKTGGRVRGVPNKATADVKAAARVYTAEAVDRLVFWMRSNSERASVSAANALLDRAHGKPAQAVTGEGGGPIELRVSWQS